MLTITQVESSPVVEMNVDGKITKEDIEKVDTFFENDVSEGEEVNLLLSMENWEGITFKGLVEDFKLISQLKKMNRAAVVADSTFLRLDAKVESMLPGVKVRQFDPNERTSAKRWLEGTRLDNEKITEHLDLDK